jgi:hypothetical protein
MNRKSFDIILVLIFDIRFDIIYDILFILKYKGL